MLWGQRIMLAQDAGLTNKILAGASAYCPIDAATSFDTQTVTKVNFKNTNKHVAAYAEFHNAHVLFGNQQVNEAFDACNVALVSVPDAQGKYLAMLIKARILTEKGLWDKTTELYKEALKLAANTNFPLQSLAISNLAYILFEQKRYLYALQYYSKWQQRADAGEDVVLKRNNFHNMGLCYMHLEKYDSAAIFLKQSLAINQATGDTLIMAITYMDLANLYYMQYKDAIAIPLFEKGLLYAIKSGDLRVMGNAYLNMAVVEENRKGYKKSLEYRKIHEKLKDSLYNRDRVWELAEKEKSFAINLKENEVKLLEQEKKLNKAELQTRSWQRNSLLLVALALLGVSAIVFWAYRQSQLAKSIISTQRNELDELNQTKDLLFSIIAHDLRSPIFSLKRAHQRLPKMVEQGNIENFKKIILNNEHTLDKIYLLLNNLLYWALDQTNRLHFVKEKIHLHTLVKQIHFDFIGAIEEKNITFENKVSEQSFIDSDINTIKIALRNLLDNAVKFTPQDGKISIGEDVNDQLHTLIIKDNGCGISQDKMGILFQINREKLQADTHQKTSTGLGLILCKTMIEKNGAMLEVTSEVNTGTIFFIHFPITNG